MHTKFIIKRLIKQNRIAQNKENETKEKNRKIKEKEERKKSGLIQLKLKRETFTNHFTRHCVARIFR